MKAGGSGRKCLPSGLVTDFREGAPACIKGLLKVAASAQGGSVPDPMAGGSCGPSALRRPRDKACPQRARPENQPAFTLSHHLFGGHFRQGWLWRQIAECVSEAGFQVLLTVPQEAQVAVCGAHWRSGGRPAALQAPQAGSRAGFALCFAPEPEPRFGSLRHRVLSSLLFLCLPARLAPPAWCISTSDRVSGAPPRVCGSQILVTNPRSPAGLLAHSQVARWPHPRGAPCPLSLGLHRCRLAGGHSVSPSRSGACPLGGGVWGQRMGTVFCLFFF